MTTLNMSAIARTRLARKRGQISAQRQHRIMRRLSPSRVQHQTEAVKRSCFLWAIRAQIARETAPRLAAIRETEVASNSKGHAVHEADFDRSVTLKLDKPVLVGHEYTPAWWEEAGERNRAAKSAAREAAKLVAKKAGIKGLANINAYIERHNLLDLDQFDE